eukprot:scaffold369494_cov19-Prasinocladus_malaysianus.AAC.1
MEFLHDSCVGPGLNNESNSYINHALGRRFKHLTATVRPCEGQPDTTRGVVGAVGLACGPTTDRRRVIWRLVSGENNTRDPSDEPAEASEVKS